MTALTDALVAAQRSALAAIGRTYVHEPFDADIVKDALDRMELRDKIEQDALIAAWGLANAYGGQLPTEGAFRLPHNGDAPAPAATDAQLALIAKLVKEKGLTAPTLPLTKVAAHEWIDQAKQR